MEEQLLGGRVTVGLVRDGDVIKRPMPQNAQFQMRALSHLRKRGICFVPKCFGADEKNRLVLEYIEGECPANLGLFTDEQCEKAFRMIRALHDAGCDFDSDGETICHGDLSPCNFVFREGMPQAIIDWDAAHMGDAATDVAYAIWMWLDAGNEEIPAEAFRRRMRKVLDAYGTEIRDIKERMVAEALRVAASIFPTVEQTEATKKWALRCAAWMKNNL